MMHKRRAVQKYRPFVGSGRKATMQVSRGIACIRVAKLHENCHYHYQGTHSPTTDMGNVARAAPTPEEGRPPGILHMDACCHRL